MMTASDDGGILCHILKTSMGGGVAGDRGVTVGAFLQCCLPCLAVEGFLVAGFCSAENRTKVFVAVTKVSGGKVECCPKESGKSAAGGQQLHLTRGFAVTNGDSGLDPKDRVLRDLREESTSEHPSIQASEHPSIQASKHLKIPASESNAHAWPAFYALRVLFSPPFACQSTATDEVQHGWMSMASDLRELRVAKWSECLQCAECGQQQTAAVEVLRRYHGRNGPSMVVRSARLIDDSI
uniref:HDC12195 n=1 Tax=Drosophila melanogaster TaxID=7227 RepID=Q6IKK5_DROME|nr:TPA_inf: HDC12195 [Drosophila melanogaster]